MNIQQLHLDTPGGAAAWLTALHHSRLARAGARLKVAAAMIAAGSQFIPLGDNGKLLADLTARVRAARVCGV
jgi:hypothetical protein